MFHPRPTVCVASNRCCTGTNEKFKIWVGRKTDTDFWYEGMYAFVSYQSSFILSQKQPTYQLHFPSNFSKGFTL